LQQRKLQYPVSCPPGQPKVVGGVKKIFASGASEIVPPSSQPCAAPAPKTNSWVRHCHGERVFLTAHRNVKGCILFQCIYRSSLLYLGLEEYFIWPQSGNFGGR